MIETKHIQIASYKYFETLAWILRRTRAKKDNVVDFDFLNSKQIEQYFDICSKLYIGYTSSLEFKEIYPEFDLLNIDEDKIIVTIEKNKIGFELFYYAKILNNSLKKIEILEDNKLKISNKDPKGFTASETKFMKYIWKPHHKLTGNDIININLFCNMRG